MTDKKLTDEEIVKALECCLCDNSECLQCQNKELCKIECDELATETIDLINRQKAEIEELKNYVNRCKSGKEHWVKCLLEKPNEAIKEFAERLKKRQELFNYLGFDKIEKCAAEAVIDNLLEEMIEET